MEREEDKERREYDSGEGEERGAEREARRKRESNMPTNSISI